MSLGNLESTTGVQNKSSQAVSKGSTAPLLKRSQAQSNINTVPDTKTLTSSEQPQTTKTIAIKSLTTAISTATASGIVEENPRLPALNVISQGVEKFAETKKLAGQVGGLLKKVNTEFNITGGTVDTFKDAFKGVDGNTHAKNLFRSTTEYSGKAQETITDLAHQGIKGIDLVVDSAFKKLDETFTPKKTLSEAVGKFSEAVGWKSKLSAGFGVAWAGAKAVGGGIVKNISKLAIGSGAFVANMGIAATTIAVKTTVSVLTPILGAVESIGRAVIAPVIVGVGNLVGKTVVGATVLVGGGLAIASKATGLSSALSYAGDKISSGAGYLKDKIHIGKGEKAMREIDSLLANPDIGISKSDVDAGSAKIKQAKGQDFDSLGFKGTAVKWVNIVRGRSEITVSDALKGKNIVGSTTVAKATDGVTWGKRAISGSNQIISNVSVTALPYAAAVTGVGGLLDGANTITRASYDIHQSRKMADRVDAFKDPTKLAIRLEAKAINLDKEAVEVKKGGIIADPDPIKAAELTDRANALRNDAASIRKMDIDPEMANIAKQVGSRHGKGLSSIGIVKGSAAVAGGTISSVNTIAILATGTALVANPVGPIILGAGIAVGVGVAAYKIHKEISRENVNNKLESQSMLVTEKLKTATGENRKGLIEIKSKIDDLRAKKDPQFAAKLLTHRIHSNPTTEAGKAAKEQATQFVKNVLKINPADIHPRHIPVAA